MAIMKWGTPPRGDAEDRRAHLVGHGENVALQHQAFGSQVPGGAQVNTGNENFDLAYRWSTAPYKGAQKPEATIPHGYRDKSRQGKCMANGDTCNGSATRSSEWKWCAGHAKAFANQER